MERYNKSQARTATEEYVKVAQKHGLTPTQLALAWCRCARDDELAGCGQFWTQHVTVTCKLTKQHSGDSVCG